MGRHMKRFLLGAGLAVVILGALPTLASAQVASGDSVAGSGVFISGSENSFEFNVAGGPSGENPSGSFSLAVPFLGETFTTTEITCLSISGDTATFAGLLAPNSGGFVYFKVTVVDQGPTGDIFGVVAYVSAPNCVPIMHPEGMGSLGTGPIASGNITVTDAHAFPTSTDQCKDGRWRSYGTTFKNQGQCVAFVQRGPKPASTGT
jgi:hypothetical protein